LKPKEDIQMQMGGWKKLWGAGNKMFRLWEIQFNYNQSSWQCQSSIYADDDDERPSISVRQTVPSYNSS
jgi:hypothetical protein